MLVCADGYVKLADFGLSKEGITGNSGAISFVGTPEYLAPEVLRKTGYGKAVDWWTLGCLLYEMLTGYPPFHSNDKHRLFESIFSGEPEYKSYMSPTVQTLIAELLIKDPDRRLGSSELGAEAVKAHPWFDGIDWEALFRKELQPPFVPQVSEEGAPDYVYEEAKRLDPTDSDRSAPAFQEQSLTFQGFTYGEQPGYIAKD